jgi:hypothetical protein
MAAKEMAPEEMVVEPRQGGLVLVCDDCPLGELGCRQVRESVGEAFSRAARYKDRWLRNDGKPEATLGRPGFIIC